MKEEKKNRAIDINVQEQQKIDHPPIISSIVTHEHHKKYGTIYYFNKISTSDEVLFPIPVLSVSSLNKSDHHQINQYNASN